VSVRARLRVAIGPADLGRRVTVRSRHPEGGFADVVGILERFDEEVVGVRDRSGTLRLLRRRDVVAGRVVAPSPPSPRRRN
jgi:hypothetical protein